MRWVHANGENCHSTFCQFSFGTIQIFNRSRSSNRLKVFLCKNCFQQNEQKLAIIVWRRLWIHCIHFFQSFNCAELDFNFLVKIEPITFILLYMKNFIRENWFKLFAFMKTVAYICYKIIFVSELTVDCKLSRIHFILRHYISRIWGRAIWIWIINCLVSQPRIHFLYRSAHNFVFHFKTG